MNKRPVIIILITFIASFAIFSGDVLLSYQTDKEFEGFPVPKNAHLERKTEIVRGYEWERASFENGIPFSYKMAIKQNGWKEVEREGGNTTYIRGNNKINLLSDTNYIEIIKEE